MDKIFAIIRREFIERVRQRWFWVMALLGPILFGALLVVPALLIGRASLKHIAIVDASTGGLGKQVASQFDTSKIQAVQVAPGSRVVDSLQLAVSAKQLDGFLILSNVVKCIKLGTPGDRPFAGLQLGGRIRTYRPNATAGHP